MSNGIPLIYAGVITYPFFNKNRGQMNALWRLLNLNTIQYLRYQICSNILKFCCLLMWLQAIFLTMYRIIFFIKRCIMALFPHTGPVMLRARPLGHIHSAPFLINLMRKNFCTPWWRHWMETVSALPAICVRNWPVNSPHKGQWRRALMFSLICTWTNS